jgi:hypothetical protein
LSYTIIDNRYKNRGDLFEGLSIWDEKSPDGDYAYRKLQGTYPVISLSFAKIKETSYQNTRKVSADMEDYVAADSLNALSDYLMRYYGKRVIILLDEYDTPMQEAYVNGYGEEMAAFTRSLFNAAFKTNPY